VTRAVIPTNEGRLSFYKFENRKPGKYSALYTIYEAQKRMMMLKNSLLFALAALAISMPAFSEPVQKIADNDTAATAPDNTRRNRDDKTKSTAQNQSNDRADIKLSASIRRKIMHKKGLSVDAQNIKIISENGSLVLRGPVKTEKEKQIIDDLAKQCCNTVSYRNELEVKNQ
jgi:osmotically-inducible protein OsmY